jgi:signal transduction histidine kinase
MVTRRSSSDSAQPPAEEELRRVLTERGKEIEALRHELSNLEAVGARFLSDAAHAIRSPLTVTHSYLEILHEDLREGLTEEQRSFLDVAYENVIRLRRLVEDLVDLAAFETGSAPVDLSRIAVGDTVEKVHVDLVSAAEAKELDLTAEVEDHLPKVEVDSVRFEDVLRRLLDNALRFTPSGGSVRMTARSDADSVVVTVEDTGVGISADRIDEAFKPFMQLHRKAGENRQGYGLGLTLCRWQIQAFGGSLEIDSDEGRGTTATIRIPFSPNEHV